MVVLGLGSNLGDRSASLSEAVKLLKAIVEVKKISPIYESEAVVPKDATKNWHLPYLNFVLIAECQLDPEKLLEEVKKIEKEIGRPENYEEWSPRIIDIDIIFFDDLVVNSKELTIPHKELLNRDFVLFPLCDICPDLIYNGPGEFSNKTINNITAKLYGYPIIPNTLKKANLTIS